MGEEELQLSDLEDEANSACFGGHGLTDSDLAVPNAKPARLDRLKPCD